MKLQFEHLVLSSFKMWTEHTLLNKGECFTNASGFFYDIKDVFNGYNTYGFPYQPIVADVSITGATIMSGVYLDGIFIRTGQSGLMDINYEKGEIYFSSGVSNTRLSGNCSIADFNVKITSLPEESLLFETKHSLKPKFKGPALTGLGPNDATFPVIYLKNFGGRMDPFAFGGMDKHMVNVRMLVFADSQFAADGVASIFKEKTRTLIPLLTGANEMPFNHLGGFSNGQYNYNLLFTGRNHSTDSAWVENVDVNTLNGNSYNELKKVNPSVFINVIDVFLEIYRVPNR